MGSGADLTGKSAANAESPKITTSAAVKMLLKIISPTPVRTHESINQQGSLQTVMISPTGERERDIYNTRWPEVRRANPTHRWNGGYGLKSVGHGCKFLVIG